MNKFLKKQAYLSSLANEIKSLSLILIFLAKSGHPGGSLSCAEILTYLYFKFAKNIDFHKKKFRDRIILSKGHAAPTLYAIAYKKKWIKKNQLKSFRKINSKLQGHPSRLDGSWIESSSGSLGQGLSFAAGQAFAYKLMKRNYKVFVIIGDGEMQEGQVWETIMFSAHHQLNNLFVLLDYNKIQSDDFNSNIINLEPLRSKINSFNWNTYSIKNANDIQEIEEFFSNFKSKNKKPNFIICNTLKGSGVSFMENKPEWHGSLTISKTDLDDSLKELNFKNLDNINY